MLRSLLLALLLMLIPATTRAQAPRMYGLDVADAMLPCLRAGFPGSVFEAKGHQGAADVIKDGQGFFGIADSPDAYDRSTRDVGLIYYFGSFVPEVQQTPLVLMYPYGLSLAATIASDRYRLVTGCFDSVYPSR